MFKKILKFTRKKNQINFEHNNFVQSRDIYLFLIYNKKPVFRITAFAGEIKNRFESPTQLNPVIYSVEPIKL